MFTNNEQIACKVKASIPINHLLVYSVVGMEAKSKKKKKRYNLFYAKKPFFCTKTDLK
jgi:hypothetical protein